MYMPCTSISMGWLASPNDSLVNNDQQSQRTEYDEYNNYLSGHQGRPQPPLQAERSVARLAEGHRFGDYRRGGLVTLQFTCQGQKPEGASAIEVVKKANLYLGVDLSGTANQASPWSRFSATVGLGLGSEPGCTLSSPLETRVPERQILLSLFPHANLTVEGHWGTRLAESWTSTLLCNWCGLWLLMNDATALSHSVSLGEAQRGD
ncbi:hypothetical protein VCV18_000603 [Metarhizium anisopliae]